MKEKKMKMAKIIAIKKMIMKTKIIWRERK